MIDEDSASRSPVTAVEAKQALTLEDGHKGIGIALVGKSISLHCQPNPNEL